MIYLQRVKVLDQWVTFVTGEDGHTRAIGDESTFVLRTALDTWLMHRDRPEFLRPIIDRTGQSWEGVTGYAFYDPDTDEVHEGHVLVFFMGDEALVDETFFTVMALAQLKAHAHATANQPLTRLCLDAVRTLRWLPGRIADELRKPFIPTFRVDVFDLHEASAVHQGGPKVAEVRVAGDTAILKAHSYSPALTPELWQQLFFEPWHVLTGQPIADVSVRGDSAMTTLSPFHRDTLRYIVEHGLAAHRLRGELTDFDPPA